MEWPRSVAGEEQEDGHADERDEIDGQKGNELDDLSQTERGVDGCDLWLSEHLDCVGRILI